MPISRETFEQGEERYSIEHATIEFLHENSERAYNVHEITVEVLEPEWAGATLDSDVDFESYVECFLEVATVSSILDALVDDGVLERRMLDVEGTERSYYRIRSSTKDGPDGRE